jgi:hypothetical protein
MVEEFISKPVQGHIIVENGKMVKEMDMEYWSFRTKSFIKVLLLNQSSMDME